MVFRHLSAALFVAVMPFSGVAGTLTASNGVEIKHSPVGGMECEEIQTRLDEIDKTGYRDGSPTPTNEADGALYNYERKLSVAYFWRCAAQLDEDQTENAFGLGFSQ
ncbi:MAG: hypothetical protein ACPGGK_03320 [Pikeienuella sp.]